MKNLQDLTKIEKITLLTTLGKREHKFTKRTLIASTRSDAFLGCLMAVNNVDEHVEDILFIGDAETALNDLVNLTES